MSGHHLRPPERPQLLAMKREGYDLRMANRHVRRPVRAVHLWRLKRFLPKVF